MKGIFDKTIEDHGKIIVAKYTSTNSKIEHTNTWDFEEVKLWCMEAIITQKI